jgi:hypothetical protein
LRSPAAGRALAVDGLVQQRIQGVGVPGHPGRKAPACACACVRACVWRGGCRPPQPSLLLCPQQRPVARVSGVLLRTAASIYLT